MTLRYGMMTDTVDSHNGSPVGDLGAARVQCVAIRTQPAPQTVGCERQEDALFQSNALVSAPRT